ncbi:MAG: serine/threonine protein kinase [Sandaracinaceae bacterium]|nr:serine/threonine protein kinase [Sandaracinaceae bacterium]
MDPTPESSAAAPSSLLGTILLDKLRVDGVIGRGGMGTVYRVTHLGTHHERALKVMNPEIKLHADALARFLREATVSGRLRSPHVVETIDTGTLPDGSHYVLMELLEGRPLEDLLGGRPMPLPRIARLLRQACGALALAHEAGIVHRDIKPDNLFVTRVDEVDETVKILDFGIARFRQGEVLQAITGDNAVLGTPLYMAPEQIGNANAADGRADVYAIGVVFYEALSGRKPYVAGSFAELVAHIFQGSAPSIEALVPGLDPRAARVVERAMARRPEDRYQDMRTLERDLETLEQAPDPLAKTAVSIGPGGAALVPVATPRSMAPPIEEAREAVVPLPEQPSSRAGLWVGVGTVSAGVLALGLLTLLSPSTSVGPALGSDDAASSPDAWVSLDAAVSSAAHAVGRAQEEPADAGLDARRPRGGRSRDDHGGLAGPDEIYGGGP